jgi:hypothetical protein
MYEIRALHGFSAPYIHPYMYDQRFLKIQKEREREREKIWIELFITSHDSSTRRLKR